MEAKDFSELEPAFGERVFQWNHQVESPLGVFTVEIETATTLRDEQLQAAAALVAQFKANQSSLIEAVYDHYYDIAADEGWMEDCGVPPSLEKPSELKPYITDRKMFVYEKSPRGEVLPSRVYIRPLWDTEHCLYFAWDEDGWRRTDC